MIRVDRHDVVVLGDRPVAAVDRVLRVVHRILAAQALEVRTDDVVVKQLRDCATSTLSIGSATRRGARAASSVVRRRRRRRSGCSSARRWSSMQSCRSCRVRSTMSCADQCCASGKMNDDAVELRAHLDLARQSRVGAHLRRELQQLGFRFGGGRSDELPSTLDRRARDMLHMHMSRRSPHRCPGSHSTRRRSSATRRSSSSTV